MYRPTSFQPSWSRTRFSYNWESHSPSHLYIFVFFFIILIFWLIHVRICSLIGVGSAIGKRWIYRGHDQWVILSLHGRRKCYNKHKIWTWKLVKPEPRAKISTASALFLSATGLLESVTLSWEKKNHEFMYNVQKVIDAPIKSNSVSSKMG